MKHAYYSRVTASQMGHYEVDGSIVQYGAAAVYPLYVMYIWFCVMIRIVAVNSMERSVQVMPANISCQSIHSHRYSAVTNVTSTYMASSDRACSVQVYINLYSSIQYIYKVSVDPQLRYLRIWLQSYMAVWFSSANQWLVYVAAAQMSV